MGLNESQDLFVRLALDAQFRKASFTEAKEETISFAPLEQEICRSARSLASKRLGAVRSILSGTSEALGSSFEDTFHTYMARSEEPHGVNRHRLDTLAFAQWLAQLTRHGSFPPAILDLLSHETAPVMMWVEQKRFLVRFHRHRPGVLHRMAQEQQDLEQAALRPAIVFWREASPGQQGYRWHEFSPWTT